MPPRNKTNAPVATAPVVDAPNPNDVTGLPVEGAVVSEGEKPPKEKKEKAPIVYAEPIQPLTAVIYPYVCVTVCGTAEQHGMADDKVEAIKAALSSIGLDGLIAYAPPITAVDAMTLIGWEVEQKDGPKFGEDYSVLDYYGKKVRLHKNIRNRPIYPNNLESLGQTILMGQWELNGEPTIISDVGNVQDNQHTLISLIIAQQRLEYEKDSTGEKLKWMSKWPDMVISIPKVIVYGIKGTDSVVNSMNTGKPRTLTDVLYRSTYFSDLPTKAKDGLDRTTAARTMDHAIKEVWQRMGLYRDAYSPRLTNSEGLSWLEAHGGMEGKFLECVRKVLEEDTTGHISKYVPCGKAACLMWLGACGKSDEMKYYVLRQEDRDSEAYMTLKWHYWKMAVSFWTEFGDREPDTVVNSGKENEYTRPGKSRGPLKPLTDILEELDNKDEPMIREKDFVIARAWNLWCEEKLITTASIKIKDTDYGEPDPVSGNRQLKKKNHQRFGSLDLGMDRLKKETKAQEMDPTEQAKVNAEIERVKAGTKAELEATSKVSKEMIAANTELSAVKPQAQQDCEVLQVQHPELQVVLVKTVSGKMELWGSQATAVAGLLGIVPNQHPNDSCYLKFDVSEWEAVSNKVTDMGYAIGLGDKVEGKLEIVMSAKPGTKKNGKK